jgi:hypothetical protein
MKHERMRRGNGEHMNHKFAEPFRSSSLLSPTLSLPLRPHIYVASLYPHDLQLKQIRHTLLVCLGWNRCCFPLSLLRARGPVDVKYLAVVASLVPHDTQLKPTWRIVGLSCGHPLSLTSTPSSHTPLPPEFFLLTGHPLHPMNEMTGGS